MKRLILILCTAVVVQGWMGLGLPEQARAQGNQNTPGTQGTTARAANGTAVGTADPVDESTLTIQDSQTNTQTPSTGPNTLSYFLRMIAVLALVLLVIYVIYRILKKTTKPGRTSDDSIKLLGTTMLSPNKAVHIILVGTKGYLIGASDNSISLISPVEDQDYLDYLVLTSAERQASGQPRTGFGDMLHKLLSRQNAAFRARDINSAAVREKLRREAASGNVDATSTEEGSFFSRARDRLKKL